MVQKSRPSGSSRRRLGGTHTRPPHHAQHAPPRCAAQAEKAIPGAPQWRALRRMPIGSRGKPTPSSAPPPPLHRRWAHSWRPRLLTLLRELPQRLPPHLTQAKTSTSNVLLSNSAQSTRGVLSCLSSCLAVVCGATLASSTPAGGTRNGRSCAPGAKTPWNLVRFTRGGGTRDATRTHMGHHVVHGRGPGPSSRKGVSWPRAMKGAQ